MAINPIRSTRRFDTWTNIIQHWHIRFVFHHRGLWYCQLCRWQYPIFKRWKCWGSFERFRECVVKHVLSPKLVSNCFKLNNMTVYNTRNRSIFYSRPVRTVLHDTESLSHLGTKVWELVPSDMKNLLSLTTFKKAIKQWKPHACPCRLCRTYIYQVGFV